MSNSDSGRGGSDCTSAEAGQGLFRAVCAGTSQARFAGTAAESFAGGSVADCGQG